MNQTRRFFIKTRRCWRYGPTLQNSHCQPTPLSTPPSTVAPIGDLTASGRSRIGPRKKIGVSRARATDEEQKALQRAQGSQEWRQAAAVVKRLGISAEAVDGALTRAFGWGSQVYWQNEKNQELPNPSTVTVTSLGDEKTFGAQVEENLEFLKSVGFGDGDLVTMIEKFPEVLGCHRDDRLRPNVEYLQRSFFLKGSHRVKAILRKPRSIGNVIDCEGECKGQCTRCWSQF